MTLGTLPAISKWSTARWSWNVRNVILPPNPEGAWGNTRGSTQLVWLAQCVDFRQTPNKVSEYTKPLTTEERIRQFRFYFWWCHEPRAQSWVVYSLYGWKIWLLLTVLYNIDNRHAHRCSMFIHQGDLWVRDLSFGAQILFFKQCNGTHVQMQYLSNHRFHPGPITLSM